MAPTEVADRPQQRLASVELEWLAKPRGFMESLWGSSWYSSHCVQAIRRYTAQRGSCFVLPQRHKPQVFRAGGGSGSADVPC